MSPPDLPRDAPVFDVFQPVQVDLVKTLRHKFQFTCMQRFDRRLCQFLHLYKPLLLDQRLYRRPTAVMGSYVMGMRLYFYQIALFFQVFYNGFSGFITLHACILAATFIDSGIVIHDIDLFQIMPLSNLKVIGVMGRCDLHRAGSKFFIYIKVCHNRNFPVYQWKHDCFANNIFVPLIFRVYRNSSIAKHGLWTGGRNLQKILRTYDRILNMPEMSALLFMLHLCVRQRSLTYRTPVDDPGAFINISLFV